MGAIKNINAWMAKTEKGKAAIKSKATKYVQDQVRKVYKTAVTISPQWSGNFAYNWVIEFSGTSPGYSTKFKQVPWNTITRDEARVAGDSEVVNAAMKDMEDIIQQIKWNNKIRIVNKSPIADDMEAGLIRLRPENMVLGTYAVLAHLKQKYRYIQ